MEVFELTNRHYRFKRLSYVGLGLVGAGVVVGLSAAVHARKIAMRDAAHLPLPE
jgi:hypothetical protein